MAAFEIPNRKLDAKLQSISSFARETIVELRDTIWAMNANEILIEDLASRVLNLIDKATAANDSIRYHFHVDDQIRKVRLSSMQGMNVYRTIQEAINNSLKYASASAISIDIIDEDESIVIMVSDNGSGFDVLTVEMGNGIKNMKQRMSDIGGEFEINATAKGTSIIIKLLKTLSDD